MTAKTIFVNRQLLWDKHHVNVFNEKISKTGLFAIRNVLIKSKKVRIV